MLHQTEEEGQVVGTNPFLVEGKDELPAFGHQEKVRVLDALGDSLHRKHGAEVVAGNELGKLLVGNLRVDGHLPIPLPFCAIAVAF